MNDLLSNYLPVVLFIEGSPLHTTCRRENGSAELIAREWVAVFARIRAGRA